MKTHLVSLTLLLTLVGLFLSPARLQAQSGEGGHLSFLSADDKAHLMKVREQVLASNPDLKAEQDSLMKERESMKSKGADASADDRKTFRENFMAHNEKMDAAMRAADPTVAPILDQVKAKMKERMESRSAAGGAPAQ